VTTPDAFQVSAEAAEVYESTFVPAIFAEWAPLVVDLAGVRPGHAVLDVACGTGIVARTAAARVGGAGRVTGVDLNEGMLAVARRLRPDLTWRVADAADLPFPDRSFDAVLCQMALMFFPDRRRALAEMGRVATPAGTVVLAVPAALEAQPAYRRLVDVVVGHAGPEARPLMGTYWACGDLDALRALVDSAGLAVTAARTHAGTARFGSVDAFVATEIEASPLAGRIAPEVYAAIRADAQPALAEFTTPAGRVDAPLYGHLVAARPRPA
jgi:ubiquinone/menaquinone biosynthesis C-methylase UbiE